MAYRPYFGYQSQNVVKVTGLEGARAYPMAPNSTAALFDENEDVFYFKTTDGAGYPSIRVFDFTERIEKQPQFVTIDELRSFMDELRKEMHHGEQPVQPEDDQQSLF
jgi:hypothetical protein